MRVKLLQEDQSSRFISQVSISSTALTDKRKKFATTFKKQTRRVSTWRPDDVDQQLYTQTETSNTSNALPFLFRKENFTLRSDKLDSVIFVRRTSGTASPSRESANQFYFKFRPTFIVSAIIHQTYRSERVPFHCTTDMD